MTPIYMGGNNENDRVASLESIAIQYAQLKPTIIMFIWSTAEETRNVATLKLITNKIC